MKQLALFPLQDRKSLGFLIITLLHAMGTWGQTFSPPLRTLYHMECAVDGPGAWGRLEARRERLAQAARQHHAIALSVEWATAADSFVVVASRSAIEPGWNRL